LILKKPPLVVPHDLTDALQGCLLSVPSGRWRRRRLGLGVT
jgi:hypothetical protein